MSLSEITTEFNQRNPPSMIDRIIGIKVEEKDILQILNFLIWQRFLKKEEFSFTDQPVKKGECFYTLTQEGVRLLYKKT